MYMRYAACLRKMLVVPTLSYHVLYNVCACVCVHVISDAAQFALVPFDNIRLFAVVNKQNYIIKTMFFE